MVAQEQLRQNETHQRMHQSLSLYQEEEADNSHWRLSHEGLTSLPACLTSQAVCCLIDAWSGMLQRH